MNNLEICLLMVIGMLLTEHQTADQQQREKITGTHILSLILVKMANEYFQNNLHFKDRD